MTQTATKEWQQSDLGEICNFAYGKNLPEKDRVNGDIPVYGSNGVVGFHNRALVPSPGIVIGRKGSAGLVHFSEVPFYPIDTTFYISQNETKTDLMFLFYLLKEINLTRLKADVGVPGINREMAYRELVSIPSTVEEQKSIARVLTTVQEAIAAQEELIAKLKELKRSMMQYLFTHGTKGEKTKMTEIGEVPEGWEVIKFGNVCDVFSGFAFKSKDFKDQGIPVVKIGDIQDGGIRYSNNRDFVPMEWWENSKLEKYKLESGDLLIAMTGATTGKVGVFDDGRAFLNQRVGKFIPKKIESGYLWYLVQTEYFFKSVVGNILASAQGNVSPTKIMDIDVALPDIKEQDDIARALFAIDEKLNAVQLKLVNHQSLFKTLLHELMSGERRVKV